MMMESSPSGLDGADATLQSLHYSPHRTETSERPPRNPPRLLDAERAKRRHMFFGFAIVIAWLFVFLAGMTIDSNPLRQNILKNGLWETLPTLGLILISYTATNAAILSVLSGMAGALAQSVVVHEPHESADTSMESKPANNGATSSADKIAIDSSGKTVDDGPAHGHPTRRKETLTAGALKSFAVFLVYMSSVSVGASDAFGATSSGQYTRVIATTSLLAFVVSFKPELFDKVLGRVKTEG